MIITIILPTICRLLQCILPRMGNNIEEDTNQPWEDPNLD